MKMQESRSISLLSCMGTVVEKLDAELLAKEAERRGLPINCQNESSERCTAIDTVGLVVDRVHEPWRTGSVAVGLFIDIKAAVPCVGLE